MTVPWEVANVFVVNALVLQEEEAQIVHGSMVVMVLCMHQVIPDQFLMFATYVVEMEHPV